MTKNPRLIVPAVLAGVVLLAIAVTYVALSADALPAFFPGHEAGSSHHHVKHGIAAAALGACALVFAWFQTSPQTSVGH